MIVRYIGKIALILIIVIVVLFFQDNYQKKQVSDTVHTYALLLQTSTNFNEKYIERLDRSLSIYGKFKLKIKLEKFIGESNGYLIYDKYYDDEVYAQTFKEGDLFGIQVLEERPSFLKIMLITITGNSENKLMNLDEVCRVEAPFTK